MVPIWNLVAWLLPLTLIAQVEFLRRYLMRDLKSCMDWMSANSLVGIQTP